MLFSNAWSAALRRRLRTVWFQMFTPVAHFLSMVAVTSWEQEKPIISLYGGTFTTTSMSLGSWYRFHALQTTLWLTSRTSATWRCVAPVPSIPTHLANSPTLKRRRWRWGGISVFSNCNKCLPGFQTTEGKVLMTNSHNGGRGATHSLCAGFYSKMTLYQNSMLH